MKDSGLVKIYNSHSSSKRWIEVIKKGRLEKHPDVLLTENFIIQ